MQLNCKEVATLPFLKQPPPFQSYPPFLAKFLLPPPLPSDSVFGRSYPLFNKEGEGGSNYVYHWQFCKFWCRTVCTFWHSLYSFLLFLTAQYWRHQSRFTKTIELVSKNTPFYWVIWYLKTSIPQDNSWNLNIR